jgi:hypothetical protein
MKSSRKTMRWLGILVILIFGLLRAWIGRFSMDPDGISYLDLSDAFRRHDWHNFLNAYWSPLYPVLLGIVRPVLPAGKLQELIAVHIANFLIYAAALATFEFFYSELIAALASKAAPSDDSRELPDWAIWAISHALFLWASLDLITVRGVSPDLCVSVFVYAIAGLLLRFRLQPNIVNAVALGTVLGGSYYAKAVMFPLAFAFMGIALLSVKPRWAAVKCALPLALGFAVVAAPLVAALSQQKHRLTFGDSGRINYAMFVAPRGVTRNWQGEPQLGITAVHPTRKILSTPPAYEFSEPIAGTFPPWYDPSYWQEGRVGRFNLKAQLSIISQHLATYFELFLHQENALLAAFLALALLAGRKRFAYLGELWPLPAMCIAALSLYMLVHVETRFLGGYVAILWIALFASFRLPSSVVRYGGYLLLAVSAALLITVVDGTARAIRDHGPYSALADVTLSDQIDRMDVHPGDRIAIIGGDGMYAARLSHLKIIAEIMGGDTPQFWRLTPEGRQRVYEQFRQSGASFLLATDPGPAARLDTGWSKVPGASFYLRKLGP